VTSGAAPRRPSRDQHYVPVGYLKGFCRTEKGAPWLTAFDLKTGAIFDSKPTEVAFERDLYFLPTARSNKLERALQRWEEDGYKAIAQVVQMQKVPQGIERQKLILFLALLIIRVPSARDALNRFQVDFARQGLLPRVKSREAWEAYQRELAKAGIGSGKQSDYETIKHVVESGELPIRANPEWITHLSLDGVMPLVGSLHPRKWTVYANDSADEFIVSDNPVSLHWTRRSMRAGPPHPGFGLPGTDVWVPLTKRLGILGRFEGAEGGVVGADRSTVASMNSRVLSRVFRFAYGPSRSFIWLRADMTISSAEEFMEEQKALAKKSQ
jgi:hypothetical protein